MVYFWSINERERDIIENYLKKGKKVEGFWELVQLLQSIDVRKMSKDKDLVRRFLIRVY
jgi:hypothetical protein